MGVQTPPDGLVPPGMDFGAALEGLVGPEDYPALVTTLGGRGYEGERLDAILGGNWLRLFRGALPGE